jgi:hypothetical protein
MDNRTALRVFLGESDTPGISQPDGMTHSGEGRMAAGANGHDFDGVRRRPTVYGSVSASPRLAGSMMLAPLSTPMTDSTAFPVSIPLP